MNIDDFLESLMKSERKSKFPLSMYYSEGTKYLKLCQFEKALKCLNDAVMFDPTSVKSLLKRSECHIALENYIEAIDDADTVLNMNSKNVHAIDLKGKAQYLRGDFEGGYLTYKAGRKIFPANKELRLGRQLCESSMLSSQPRSNTQYYLDDVYSILENPYDDDKFQKKIKNRRSARECFNQDAKYLEVLMADKYLTSVHGICKEAADYIRSRERFWCMETPLHNRTRRQRTKVRHIKRTHKDISILICEASKRRAENFLLKGMLEDCIDEAENLMRLTENIPKEYEEVKMKFQCDSLHLTSLAYKEADEPERAFRCLVKELAIAREFDLTMQQAKIYHQLGERYQITGDLRRAVQCLNKIVDTMTPEALDELASMDASPEDIREIQDAHDWAEDFVGGLLTAIRESIFAPIIDSMSQVSEEITSQESSGPSKTSGTSNSEESSQEEPMQVSDESKTKEYTEVSDKSRKDTTDLQISDESSRLEAIPEEITDSTAAEETTESSPAQHDGK